MYDTSNEKVRAKFVFRYYGHCEMVSYKNNLIDAIKKHNESLDGKNIPEIADFSYDRATDDVFNRFTVLAQENGYEIYVAYRVEI